MKRTFTPRDAYAEREERLRPRRVVAVDEHRLGAVDRQRLGVRDEALDREPQVEALLDGALREDAGPSRLGADQDRDRIQRRVARDADGRLDLGEAARRSLGRVGREQRRVLLQVRHVRLVRRRPARAQLLQREHELDRVEHPDHARKPRRGQAAREADELGRGDVDVDEAPSELTVVEGRRLARRVEIDAVARDEVVERVPVLRARPSSSTIRPSSTTSDGSGSFGPFIATSPSSASGSISTSRRRSRSSRADVPGRAISARRPRSR